MSGFLSFRISNQQVGEDLTCKRQFIESRPIGTQFALIYLDLGTLSPASGRCPAKGAPQVFLRNQDFTFLNFYCIF
jgi:hypothetical protein